MKSTNKTLIYAHRGANKEAAENTQSAFEKALHYPIDGIETDVQMSRDEVNVLWHDDTLERIGLPDKRIADFDWVQLQTMNFAALFSAEAQPEGAMSLQNFIEQYRTRCRLLIEIKHDATVLPVQQKIKVKQAIQTIQAVKREGIVMSSFHLPSLIYANQISPGFPLIYNLEPEQKLAEARNVLDAHPFLHGLCVHISTLDKAMVSLLHRQNKYIAVYTCNTDEEITTALKLGVDVLISDFPNKALQFRDG